MFAKFTVQIFIVAALATGTLAGPLALKPSTGLAIRDSHSFNNWGGFSSLAGFDHFYGVDNFSGSEFEQTVVQETETQTEVVCHSETVEIIQQRLLVLRELAKRIITEQICEVETQTIVFEQATASLDNFSLDLRRQSGHQVGFDSNIVQHFGEIVNSDNSLSTNDFGFSGLDLGKSTVVIHGNNWDDSTSHFSVDSAFFASMSAVMSSGF